MPKPNNAGITPIHIAAEVGNLEILDLLLKQPNANINIYDGCGITPLTHLIYTLREPLGSRLDESTITKGINTIKFLLSKRANPDGRDPEFKKALRETLPLKTALTIDPRIVGPYRIPLVMAAVADNAEIVKILLEAGADVNCSGHSQETALYIAVSRGNLEIVKILLDQPEIEVNMLTRQKQTPLAAAVIAFNNSQRRNNTNKLDNFIAVIKLLLEKGANPNIPDMIGRTLLDRVTEINNKDLSSIFDKYAAKF